MAITVPTSNITWFFRGKNRLGVVRRCAELAALLLGRVSAAYGQNVETMSARMFWGELAVMAIKTSYNWLFNYGMRYIL